MSSKLHMIEEKINKLLITIKVMIVSYIQKLIPQKYKDLYQQKIVDTIKKNRSKVSDKLSHMKQDLIQKAHEVEEMAKHEKEQFSFGRVISQIVPFSKELLKKALNFVPMMLSKFKTFWEVHKSNFKRPFQLVFSAVKQYSHIVKAYILGLQSTTLIIAGTSSVVILLALTSIFIASKNILEDTAKIKLKTAIKPKREISSRPFYHMLDAKQILITNIHIPIYIESTTSIKSLNADLVLQSSNRYIKAYFYENEHLVKNTINNSMQAVVPEFPLTPEGKEIIKQKVRAEVNKLIKRLEIGGEIETVFFYSVIGG
ncbi:MAG: hypothetical protein ISR65_01080 [Bacteriovoracaceae bacterium]|nr:hypothetical protein [Bacteriovoracaceae bacterium]